MKHTFDSEKRQETARIDKLRGLLGELEKPEFWDRLSQARDSSIDERDSFQRAIERRAEALGVSPQKLLSDYAQQLRQSRYPTPDCLDAEEVQRIVASHEPSLTQAAHVQSCTACQQLLAACQQSSAEKEKLMVMVQEAAAEADQLGATDQSVPTPDFACPFDKADVVLIDLVTHLAKTNEKFRGLTDELAQYHEQLAVLEAKPRLTPEEELTQHRLKELKLHLSQQMNGMIKYYRVHDMEHKRAVR